MKLATMNMIATLERIITPVIKSYFSDIAYDYKQDQLLETKSRMFGLSQRLISVVNGVVDESKRLPKTSVDNNFKPRASCFVAPTHSLKQLMGTMSQNIQQGTSRYNLENPSSENQLPPFMSSAIVKTQDNYSRP